MTAVVTVRLAEPQFEGQTKEVLGTPAVSRLVAKVVERELTGFLGSTKMAPGLRPVRCWRRSSVRLGLR